MPFSKDGDIFKKPDFPLFAATMVEILAPRGFAVSQRRNSSQPARSRKIASEAKLFHERENIRP